MTNWKLYITLFIIVFAFLGCGKKNVPTPFKQGHFFDEGRYLRGENRFATDLPVFKNEIKKLTWGDLNYYSWKTIERNILTERAPKQAYSAYVTITNKEYEGYGIEGKQYLRTEDRVLNNYLFFLDDRRVIYISVDDFRFVNIGSLKNYGKVYLLYKELFDELKDSEKVAYNQAARGYYSLHGDKMEIHFDGKKDFFIKASVSNDYNQITFDSVSVFSENILSSDGLNDEYEGFNKIFSPRAQPIFEVPVEGDGIIDQRFYLSFGLLHTDVKNAKFAEMKKQIMKQGNVKDHTEHLLQIDSISYEFDYDEFVYKRKYFYTILDLTTLNPATNDFSRTSHTHTEVLDDMFSW